MGDRFQPFVSDRQFKCETCKRVVGADATGYWDCDVKCGPRQISARLCGSCYIKAAPGDSVPGAANAGAAVDKTSSAPANQSLPSAQIDYDILASRLEAILDKVLNERIDNTFGPILKRLAVKEQALDNWIAQVSTLSGQLSHMVHPPSAPRHIEPPLKYAPARDYSGDGPIGGDTLDSMFND